VHHQYSSSVSPFQANTGTPAGVLRGAVRADDDRGGGTVLGGEDVAGAQRTSAPSATRVSMSTAVWTVMCSEPAMRAPASGLASAYSLAHRHQAGHLVLGQTDLVAAGSARDRSATLWSWIQ
jgi:hypothetical protein